MPRIFFKVIAYRSRGFHTIFLMAEKDAFLPETTKLLSMMSTVAGA